MNIAGERIAEATRQRAEGMTYEQIAFVMNVSRKTVKRWLNPAFAQKIKAEKERAYIRKREAIYFGETTEAEREAIRQRERARAAARRKDILTADRNARKADMLTRLKPARAEWADTKRKIMAAAARLRQTMKGAAVRGLEFSLPFEWFAEALTLTHCQATGLPFEETGNFARSIDRVDNSKGYVVGNVQVVAWIYNRAKGVGTDADVLRMALALAERAAQWD